MQTFLTLLLVTPMVAFLVWRSQPSKAMVIFWACLTAVVYLVLVVWPLFIVQVLAFFVGLVVMWGLYRLLCDPFFWLALLLFTR